MDIIRNYLESMFSQLPNTPEVLKAKYELGQMMEDKYSELLAEGMPDNEAIGVVISEFGNLEELAEELGIGRFMDPASTSIKRTVTMEEVRRYLSDAQQRAFLLALGVFFCVISVMPVIIGDGFATRSTWPEAIGVGLLFLLAAIGVGLIVFSSFLMKRWAFLKNEPCSINMDTIQYVREKQDASRISRAFMMTVGIILCILSVVPVSVAGSLNIRSEAIMDLCAAFIFLLAGLGVFLIIYSTTRHASCQHLLDVNEKGTVGATYGAEARDRVYYESETVSSIMELFWPSVTCLYLIVSFLTFDWHITWIIWPIAAIIHKFVGYMLGVKTEK